jgi:integrase
MEAYQRALDGQQMPIGSTRTRVGSIDAAIIGYYDSGMFFGSLAPSTQAIRRQILERFRAEHGDKPIALLPKKFIVLSLDKLKPGVAINWLTAIRHLMQYAISANLCESDPTHGIKLKTHKSDGIYTWSEQEISAYEAAHPIGSKARLALALGLYTAQRRSDVLRMGRQHIREGILAVKQQKTGAELRIPVHSDLRAIIDATPGDHLTFLVTRTGKPYAGDNFSAQFREWCATAGLSDECSFHGLRKAACRRLAEAGCSVNEIAAVSGHATLREV